MRGCTTTTDEVNRIDTMSLRKSGLLKEGHLTGTTSWTSRGEPSGSISFELQVNSWPNPSFMELHYVNRNLQNDTEMQMDYRINLLPSFCQYGGVRWWFQCPNGSCHGRVRILYKSGKYFVCRKCARLWYDSQRYVNPSYKPLVDECKAERLFDNLKRRYYRGKTTRKYQRYLKLSGLIETQAVSA